MTEEDTGSAAKSKVVLPGQTGDAMSAPEGANASSVAAHNNKVHKAGAESQEELAKEVTWHDQHGMDLTQVREFEPSEPSDSDDEGGGQPKRSSGSCCIIS